MYKLRKKKLIKKNLMQRYKVQVIHDAEEMITDDDFDLFLEEKPILTLTAKKLIHSGIIPKPQDMLCGRKEFYYVTWTSYYFNSIVLWVDDQKHREKEEEEW